MTSERSYLTIYACPGPPESILGTPSGSFSMLERSETVSRVWRKVRLPISMDIRGLLSIFSYSRRTNLVGSRSECELQRHIDSGISRNLGKFGDFGVEHAHLGSKTQSKNVADGIPKTQNFPPAAGCLHNSPNKLPSGLSLLKPWNPTLISISKKLGPYFGFGFSKNRNLRAKILGCLGRYHGRNVEKS